MKKLYLLLIMMLAILCITACGENETLPEGDVNPDSIKLNAADGLNEQIHLNVASSKNDITVYYKASDAEEYSVLDRELMLTGENGIDCYILGLAKGIYDVKIEQGEGDNFARKIITGIDTAGRKRK